MTIPTPTNEQAMEEGTAANTNNDQVAQDVAVDVDVDADEESPPNNRSACYKKLLVGLLLLGFIVYVVVDSLTTKHVRGGIVSFLEWIENNIVAGVFSFMAVYFIATIFWVPGSILTLGAGFVFSSALNSLGWGVLLGTAAVWVGASAGATAAFVLGRYLFRDSVGHLSEKYAIFQALDNALKDNGLKIMVLLRLSPIIPFNALNYIAGVTAVQFWHYVIACIAMLPGTIVYVFLGASAGSLAEIGGDDEEEADSNKVVTYVVIGVGVAFGVLAIAVTTYYAKQELNKILEEKAAETNPEDGSQEIEGGQGNAADEKESM